MRTLRTLVVLTSLAVLTTLLGAGSALGSPHRPRAELVAKDVTGFVSGDRITASASVKNKGSHKARRSHTTFLLSRDAIVSGDDLVLGTAGTVKIRPKRSKTSSGSFTVPAAAGAGSYRLIACADSGRKIKERKEGNNCKASRGTVVVGWTRQVTITWSVAGGLPPAIQGNVTPSVVGGTCTAPGATGSCTVTAGASAVTLSAGGEVPALLTFLSWGPASGGACPGVTSGLKGEDLSLINPTGDESCVATYVP
jgi:hypothetical protein